MGKYRTPDELVAAISEMQSLKDREVAEARAKVEAYETLLAGAGEPEQEAHQPPPDPPREELSEFVAAAPGDAFTQTLQYAPHLIGDVIDLIGEHHGDAQARRAMLALQNIQLQAMHSQQEQQTQEQAEVWQQEQARVEAAQQYAEARVEAEQAMTQQYGDEYTETRSEVAHMLQQIAADPEMREQYTQRFPTPYAILDHLHNTVWREWQKQAPASEPTPQPSFVELGGASVPDAEPSYQDQKMAAFAKTGLFGSDD
jgi:hypothetical protein